MAAYTTATISRSANTITWMTTLRVIISDASEKRAENAENPPPEPEFWLGSGTVGRVDWSVGYDGGADGQALRRGHKDTTAGFMPGTAECWGQERR